MQKEMSEHDVGTVKVKPVPLPFRYQFSAGAVAGISEVSVYTMWIFTDSAERMIDIGDVRSQRIRGQIIVLRV
jgi:hypothetical protein